MKTVRSFLLLLIGILLLSCSAGGTYFILLRYRPVKEFPLLQRKIGPNLALAPLSDHRSDTLYVGLHAPLTGTYLYFKNEPFPLERALRESLIPVMATYGIKVLPGSSWDGKPEGLAAINADSALLIEVKRLWVEGKAGMLGTKVTASASFVFHLGVKKEGKVYTRNIEIERELTLGSFSPEKAEQIINQMLTDVFDSFFSNPY